MEIDDVVVGRPINPVSWRLGRDARMGGRDVNRLSLRRRHWHVGHVRISSSDQKVTRYGTQNPDTLTSNKLLHDSLLSY